MLKNYHHIISSTSLTIYEHFDTHNSAMGAPDLILDPSLKYWVLLPISFVMVLVGILRQNVTILLQPSPKLQPYMKVRQQQYLQKSSLFRMNSNVLSHSEFEARQTYLLEKLKSDAYYAEPVVADGPPPNPLTDPGASDAMFSMLKANMANYIPQTVIMWWVNFFFAGFVIMRLPFPLTLRFKSMLQAGVATPDLDVRWVSSLSWYFVNLLGLRPVYSLFLNDASIADQMLQQQVPPAMPGGPTADKLFGAEAENVQILSYKSIFNDIEDRVLKSYK